MSLRDDILALRNRASADFIAAHDYFLHTTYAWEIARKVVEDGRAFVIENEVTKSKTNQSEFAEKANVYVRTEIVEATFLQFHSVFEAFVVDFLQLWLCAFPGSLSKKQLEFRTVLESTDKNAVTEFVVRKEINELLYKRPADWFEYINSIGNFGCPPADEIEKYSEARASRDLLIHNRGIANQIYASKAGKSARHSAGERVIVSEQYHRDVWKLLSKIAADLSNAAISKA